MPDRAHQSNDAGKTGAIRRADLEEPLFRNDAPPRPPTAPELSESYESTTGMMPVFKEASDSTTENQDADAPV